MSKKNELMQGLDSVLASEPKDKKTGTEMQEAARRSRVGRPAIGDNRERLSSKMMYTSLAVDRETYAKLRQIAQLNGLPYKDLINAAMKKFIELYETKHGPVTTPPESHISADSLV